MIFAGEDVIFAKGEAYPVVREEDSAEVGVAVEENAEEVEGFAFLPVGCGPEVGDGGVMGVIAARGVHFDCESVLKLKTPEVVDDAELLIGGVIDGGEACEPVELQFGIFLEELRDFPPIFGIYVDARVFVIGEGLDDFFRELVLKNRGDLLRSHGAKYRRVAEAMPDEVVSGFREVRLRGSVR